MEPKTNITSYTSNVFSIHKEETTQKATLHENAWLHIFSFLPRKDFANLKLTCKQWYRLTSNNLLWLPIFKRKFDSWTFPTENKDINWQQLCLYFENFYYNPKNLQLIELENQESIIEDKKKFATDGEVLVIYDMQSTQVRKLRSKEFIFNTPCTTTDVAINGDQIFLGGFHTLEILNIEEKRKVSIINNFFPVASCSYKNQIIWMDPAMGISIWDIETQQEIKRLKPGQACGIQVQDNLLAIGLSQKGKHKFKIYDLQAQKYINDIETQEVLHWYFKNDLLIVANNNAIEIINIQTQKRILISKNGITTDPINSIQVNESTIVTGEGNYLRVWDIAEGKLRHEITLKGPAKKFILKNETLISATDKMIQLWNISKTNASAIEICSYRFPEEAQLDVKFMFIDNNRVIVQTNERLITLLLQSK